jgi:hypothetical protein
MATTIVSFVTSLDVKQPVNRIYNTDVGLSARHTFETVMPAGSTTLSIQPSGAKKVFSTAQGRVHDASGPRTNI